MAYLTEGRNVKDEVSLPYLAPEIFNSKKPKEKPMDVWAAGVILF
jgi:serine/threonine protein kinase